MSFQVWDCVILRWFVALAAMLPMWLIVVCDARLFEWCHQQRCAGIDFVSCVLLTKFVVNTRMIYSSLSNALADGAAQCSPASTALRESRRTIMVLPYGVWLSLERLWGCSFGVCHWFLILVWKLTLGAIGWLSDKMGRKFGMVRVAPVIIKRYWHSVDERFGYRSHLCSPVCGVRWRSR